MFHQRKRFNYLSSQQRAINNLNIQDAEKTSLLGKTGSNIKSSTTCQYDKQQITIQSYAPQSKNSSAKKQNEPLNEYLSNISSLDQKNSASKGSLSHNKQNAYLSMKASQREQKSVLMNQQLDSLQILKSRIQQLQTQNANILKETQDKFLQMQNHLEKVETILIEKQKVIENLTQQNKRLVQKSKNFEQLSIKLYELNDQKEQLLKIIAEKNKHITNLKLDLEIHSEREADLVEQMKQMGEQIEKLALPVISTVAKISLKESNTQTITIFTVSDGTQTKQLQQISADNETQTQQFERNQKMIIQKSSQSRMAQTELVGQEVEQMIANSLNQQSENKINYRQKYESLFKKALQMEDEIYQLKEELFDSQSQFKTLQQEFNTFKIFNQIEKINHDFESNSLH